VAGTGDAGEPVSGAAEEEALILVVYGTTGELIKLAPVLRLLRSWGSDYLSATTAQQVEQIPTLLESFELPPPNWWLARGAGGRDLRRNADVPRWLGRVLIAFSRLGPSIRSAVRTGNGRPLVLVHGDTFTTVLGGLMGRAMGFPVAHVEAGLRSFDVRHPFPEEVNRRCASALATLHFAPSAWAASHLQGGSVVNTGSNTIRDSLLLAEELIDQSIRLPEGRFGIVSLHRFELLRNGTLLRATIKLLAEHARRVPLLFVEHPVTVAALRSKGLAHLLDGSGFRRIPRLSFLEFTSVMRRSSFLITDSGGNQEESYYLDLPCLVHRKRTERREGLGENVVLSEYRLSALERFLQAPGRHRRRGALPDASPSEVIVEDLRVRGFAASSDGRPAWR
jgi:UDP-N-acetylglucosamine 2-epimerase (non-hydrolysing)